MLRVPQGCAVRLPRAQSCSQGQGQRGGGSLRSACCQSSPHARGGVSVCTQCPEAARGSGLSRSHSAAPWSLA